MKQFASFTLDSLNQCLWQNGSRILLPPKPFAVLQYLVDNAGRLITHDEMLEALWPDTYVQPQVLRTYMLELRKILGDDPAQPAFIQTLPKRGYCFVAPVIEDGGTEHGLGKFKTGPVSPAIVGRDEELAALMTVAASLRDGQRQTIFITGEAGIGKTALVEAFCQRAGLSVARGQCVEGFGAKEEYYPVMEALAQLCAASDGERACRILSRLSPVWLQALNREVSVKGEHSSGERMPGDLCAAFEELATEKPLLLIFEDMNWADASTVHLISALARRRARTGLMVVATYRPQASVIDDPLRALKQDLLMRRLCTEIALTPLPKAALKELLVRELKQPELPSGLASFIHQHSEGNPLFAIAILEHLIAQRFLVCEESSGATLWKQRAQFQEMEAGVPDGLAQMIEAEIARLPPQDQRILEAGSLINVVFPAWAVAAALEEDLAGIEELCEDLSRRLYFLKRGGQDELPDGTCSGFYAFSHGLYREVLYQRQATARRAKRHVKIAERLSSLFVDRESSVAREMAFHYEAAAKWQLAVTSLRSAAQDAQQRRAFAEALELLQHTQRLLERLTESERVGLAQAVESEIVELQQRLHQVGGKALSAATKA